jgi:hypothetical protein
MRRLVAVSLFAAAMAPMAFAGVLVYIPEIDPGAAGNAVALIAGALLVIRASRRK